MKNIIEEKPSVKLTGRLLETAKFVEKKNIENKRILDIGCGYGWFENYALRNKVKEIIGTEITKSDLSTARKNIKNKKASFKVASAIKLPFPDNYFDIVVSWEVLEHIPKNTEVQMFKEVARVLKKKGLFYISTPYDSFASKVFDPAWWLIGHRHYSEDKIRLYAARLFMVKNIKLKGGWWSIIASLDMYFSKWVLKREPVFTQYMQSRVDYEYSKKYSRGFKNIYVSMIKK